MKINSNEEVQTINLFPSFRFYDIRNVFIVPDVGFIVGTRDGYFVFNTKIDYNNSENACGILIMDNYDLEPAPSYSYPTRPTILSNNTAVYMIHKYYYSLKFLSVDLTLKTLECMYGYL